MALKVLILFLICFIWVRYFVPSFWISASISLAFAIVICLLTRSFRTKKSAATSLKIREQTEAENSFLSLATGKNALSFFYHLAKEICPSVEKKSNCIILNRSEKLKEAIYPCLKFSNLTVDDIAKIISDTKKFDAEKIVIFCGGFDDDAASFAKNFDRQIVLLDKYASYAIYKQYNTFPPISMEYKKSGQTAFRDTIKLIFNRDKARGYFLCALFLFLSSLIIRASLYYSVFASILFIMALIAYSNPYSQENLPETLL